MRSLLFLFFVQAFCQQHKHQHSIHTHHPHHHVKSEEFQNERDLLGISASSVDAGQGDNNFGKLDDWMPSEVNDDTNIEPKHHRVKKHVQKLANHKGNFMGSHDHAVPNRANPHKTAQKPHKSGLKELLRKSREREKNQVTELQNLKQQLRDLIQSLNDTKANVTSSYAHTSSVERQLSVLHREADIMKKLEKEVSRIQHNAAINYETGKIELTALESISESTSPPELIFENLDASSKETLLSFLEEQDIDLEDVSENMLMELVEEIPEHVSDPAVINVDFGMLSEIVILLCSATSGGVVAKILGAPPVIGYIIGGMVVGPSGFALISKVKEIDTLAQFGSVFFLFGHGVMFSLSENKRVRRLSLLGALLATGTISVIFKVYFKMFSFSDSDTESLLLGLACSLSSLTMVLSNIDEHIFIPPSKTKLLVGYLTTQNIFGGLFFALPLLVSGNNWASGPFLWNIGFGLAFLISFYFIFERFLWPRMMRKLSRKSSDISIELGSAKRKKFEEIYFLSIISAVLIMALLTEFLGLSLDLGAFASGILVSRTPYAKATVQLIHPLSSVFAALLFASIGMIISVGFLYKHWLEILTLVVELTLIKGFVVLLVFKALNFSTRTSVICATGLAHVGEFSLLLGSKFQAHGLLTRKPYLLFLSASATTLIISPFVLKLFTSLCHKRMSARTERGSFLSP